MLLFLSFLPNSICFQWDDVLNLNEKVKFVKLINCLHDVLNVTMLMRKHVRFYVKLVNSVDMYPLNILFLTI